MATKNNLQSRNLLRYLEATWHPDHRPKSIGLTEYELIGLQILKADPPTENSGSVAYAVSIQQGKRIFRTGYHDRFERIDGCWVYVDGVVVTKGDREQDRSSADSL